MIAVVTGPGWSATGSLSWELRGRTLVSCRCREEGARARLAGGPHPSYERRKPRRDLFLGKRGCSGVVVGEDGALYGEAAPDTLRIRGEPIPSAGASPGSGLRMTPESFGMYRCGFGRSLPPPPAFPFPVPGRTRGRRAVPKCPFFRIELPLMPRANGNGFPRTRPPCNVGLAPLINLRGASDSPRLRQRRTPPCNVGLPPATWDSPRLLLRDCGGLRVAVARRPLSQAVAAARWGSPKPPARRPDRSPHG